MALSLVDALATLPEDQLNALEQGNIDAVSQETINFLERNLSDEAIPELAKILDVAAPTLSPTRVEEGRSITSLMADVGSIPSIRAQTPVEQQQFVGQQFLEDPIATLQQEGVVAPLGREAARIGIETGAEIAGATAGQLVGGLPASLVGATVAGEAAREGTRALGLRPPTQDRLGELGEAALAEGGGILAERALRTGETLLPRPLRAGAFLFEKPVFETPEALELDVIVGNQPMKVSEVLREEGEDVSALTVSQRTGRQVGGVESEAFAKKIQQDPRKIKVNKFKKKDDEFLERRRKKILDGVQIGEEPIEHMDEAFKRVISDRIGSLNTSNNIIRQDRVALINKLEDKVLLPTSAGRNIVLVRDENMRPIITVPEGSGLPFAIEQFKKSVADIDVPTLDSTFNELLEVIAQPVKSGDRPLKLTQIPSSLTPSQHNALVARLDKLKGDFRETKVSQKEMAGVLARFERDVLDPLFQQTPDPQAKKLLNSRARFASNAEKMAELRNSKALRLTGLTEAQQARSAKSGEQVENLAFSTPAAFRQVKRVLNDAGETEVLQRLEDNFVRNIWDTAVRERGKARSVRGAVDLDSRKLREFLNNDSNRLMVREIKGEGYLDSLDRQTALLEARESDPVLLSSVVRGTPEEQASVANLAAQKLGAKLTGHSLRDATLSLALLARIPQAVMKARFTDEQLLAKLSDPDFVSKWDLAMTTEITDEKAHALASSILREFGTPISQEVWNNTVGLMQAGALDTVPEDVAEEIKNATNQ